MVWSAINTGLTDFAGDVMPVLQRPLWPALLAGRITELYSER